MFSYYIKIAFRNIFHQRFYAAINIFGLGIGLAGCFIIVLFVLQELSYDTFHKDADRIFRVNYSANLGGDDYTIENTPPPLAQTLKQEFPEVEFATRVFPGGEQLVRYDDKSFGEKNILGVDSSFLSIFSFQLEKGDPHTAFTVPNSVVLTASTAEKYFGREEAVGKLLYFGKNQEPYTVTGILKDPPSNSHLQFSMLTSLSSYEQVEQFNWSWVWCGLVTYVKLKENAAPEVLEAKFPELIQTHASHTIGMLYQNTVEEFKKSGKRIELSLQPLSRLYLYSSHLGGGISLKGDIKYLRIFSFVALFIILLACVNFMNLSTARFARRGKEVGIRKVMGSHKKQLVYQFLAESLLTTFLALLLASTLSALFIQSFAETLQIQPGLSTINIPVFVLLVFGLSLLVGVLAGAYPAFFLSSYKPVEVLKGRLRMGLKSSGLRNGLVVFQFAVSICLLICTALVFKQLDYLKKKDLGFTKENVLIINNADRLANQLGAFKQELGQLPGVLSSSNSRGLPSKTIDSDLFIPEGKGLEAGKLLSFIAVDEDFVETLDLKVKEGRNFSKDHPSDFASDENAVLLNEAAANALGWQDPLNKELLCLRFEGLNLRVIGVVKNFNVRSLYSTIEPLVILPASKAAPYLSVRIQENNYQQIVAAAEQLWGNYSSGLPFEYSFLEDDFNALHKAEQRQGKIFSLFTGLAILIACLGLLGLSAYAAEQRTKEVGIRKVLGSSVAGVAGLLSTSFIKLLVIANLLAWPIAWYGMDQWLQDFAYKTEMSWWIFALAGIATFILALLTVSFQSVKAALANPVDSLRSE